jgi:hypothetical protein
MSIYMYVNMYVCMYTYEYIFVSIRIYAYVFIHIYIYVYISMYVYVYIHIYIYMHICMYTSTCIHIIGISTSTSVPLFGFNIINCDVQSNTAENPIPSIIRIQLKGKIYLCICKDLFMYMHIYVCMYL